HQPAHEAPRPVAADEPGGAGAVRPVRPRHVQRHAALVLRGPLEGVPEADLDGGVPLGHRPDCRLDRRLVDEAGGGEAVGLGAGAALAEAEEGPPGPRHEVHPVERARGGEIGAVGAGGLEDAERLVVEVGDAWGGAGGRRPNDNEYTEAVRLEDGSQQRADWPEADEGDVKRVDRSMWEGVRGQRSEYSRQGYCSGAPRRTFYLQTFDLQT